MIMTEEEIFQNDLIGDRKNLAERIASLIEQEDENSKGFVLAINGEWGTGKTTFVNMLVPYLEEIKKYKVINFNCWERDFVEDPLIAIFAELTEVIGTGEKEYNNAVKALSKIAVGALVGAAKAVIGEPTTAAFGALSGAIDAAEDEYKKYIDSYKEQVKSMDCFKTALKEYVDANIKNGEHKKVVFIIDELDRCNPRYAVKVLERIKHLFDIPNLFFILPICKSQLECAIKGYYGSESLDANNYLRRFIDLEIMLPNGKLLSYCKKLMDKYYFHESNIKDYIGSIYRLFQFTNTDLRTIEKILCHLGKVVNGPAREDYFDTLLLLCYLKFENYELYDKINRRVLSYGEFLVEFDNLYGTFCENIDSDTSFIFFNLVIHTLVVYKNSFNIEFKWNEIETQNTFKHFSVKDMENYINEYIDRVPMFYLNDLTKRLDHLYN